MRKSLERPLTIAFICRTSVAWLSTCSFSSCCFHFPSPPSYIWPQDINLGGEFHSVSLGIENWEVDVKEPQIGRLQLWCRMIPKLAISHFTLGQKFRLLRGMTEVEAHIGQNAIRPDYSTFYHITLFAATQFIRMNWFSAETHLHLEWIELGTCGSLGQKLAAVLWWIIPLWEWNRAVWD